MLRVSQMSVLPRHRLPLGGFLPPMPIRPMIKIQQMPLKRSLSVVSQYLKKIRPFFKTSTGDEPAAGPKGLITGVKKGKTYFTSWSMNVKIEGKNVKQAAKKLRNTSESSGLVVHFGTSESAKIPTIFDGQLSPDRPA
ncbi:hypothetical protein MNBD_GAMMA12-343 [hydrothermal vent metagenome]|uniref:Uncharacterized protein n=1 Tax=hydrothermal vent metagenome TaxID=652676 RepID=A0A3B0YSE0_9ZZZZ